MKFCSCKFLLLKWFDYEITLKKNIKGEIMGTQNLKKKYNVEAA